MQSKSPPVAAPAEQESSVGDDWEVSRGATKLRPATSEADAKPKAADNIGPKRCVM